MGVVILTIFTARALHVSVNIGLINCRMPLISFFATSALAGHVMFIILILIFSVPRNVVAALNSVPLSAQCFVHIT